MSLILKKKKKLQNSGRFGPKLFEKLWMVWVKTVHNQFQMVWAKIVHKRLRIMDDFGPNCSELIPNGLRKPSRIRSGQFGPNRLDLRTVWPKPSVSRISDCLCLTV